ncbi:MAG TPA: histidinol-phosphate transaminase [Bacteroidota bacterium]
MKKPIEDLVRPNIRSLTPYRSARQDHNRGILLDANENSFGSVLRSDGIALNRYPDPSQALLRGKLAELNSVSPESIFTGVGSDEIIDLLIRIFCRPDADSVLVIEPTYGMYRVSAGINGIGVISSLLSRDFQIDLEDAGAKASRVKLVFCCSPNNPTGNLLRSEDILALCSQTNGLVVVDEAYIDFAQAPSLSAFTGDHENLVVLRTLSKAWGLAAIRLGYCIASPLVIEYLMKIKPPYNINALTSHFALQALGKEREMKETVQAILLERTKLAAKLESIPCVEKIFPSDSNFLTVRCTNARLIRDGLASKGVIVRDRSSEPLLENCLRITVGTPAQNDTLVRIMAEISS